MKNKITAKDEISVEQALSILPDGEDIHVFLNSSFGLIGADWRRIEIEDKIKSCERLRLAGPQARSMGHGMVIFPHGAKKQSDLLFVETDEGALEKLEKTLED